MDIELIEVDPNSCPEQLLCTEEEVLFLLTSLDARKASGPEGILACMLKATAAAITPVVTKLFNLSIALDHFLRQRNHQLLFQFWNLHADRTLPSNYWPISLLAILIKVLKKYICFLVMEELHLGSHSTFHQWGFWSGHSTSSALTTVIDDWLKNMELNWQISLFCLLWCSKSIWLCAAFYTC